MGKKIVLGFVIGMLSLSGIAFAQQGIGSVIDTLKGIGVFEFYLPFLLTFSILYALLLKSKIFGETKGLTTIIALSVAGFIMVYTPVGITLSQFLANFVANSIVAILTILLILIFANMLKDGGFNVTEIVKGRGLWVALLLVALVAFGIFVSSGGSTIFPGIKLLPRQTFDSFGGVSVTTWAILILIVGTGLIVWSFAKGSSPTPPAGGAPRPP